MRVKVKFKSEVKEALDEVWVENCFHPCVAYLFLRELYGLPV